MNNKRSGNIKVTTCIIFMVLSLMLGFIFGLAVGCTQQYNYDTKVIDPVITQRKELHNDNEGNYVSDNLFDIHMRNWYSNSITIDYENNSFYGEKVNSNRDYVNLELYRNNSYLITIYQTFDTGHKQFTFDFEDYSDCTIYFYQTNLGSIRFNVNEVCDILHFTSISFDYTIENNVVRIANIMSNASNTIEGNYLPYESYGLIYYSQTNYNNNGTQKYNNGILQGEINTSKQIVLANMSIVNDTNLWSLPNASTYIYASNVEFTNNSFRPLFINDSTFAIDTNKYYNGILYPRSYLIRGSYNDVTTKFDTSYVNFPNNELNRGLIGFSIKGYLPTIFKELNIDVYFNSNTLKDVSIIENEERVTLTYLTNSVKNVSLSVFTDVTPYTQQFIEIKSIDFKINYNTQGLVNNSYNYIDYESNIRNDNIGEYYQNGYNLGFNSGSSYGYELGYSTGNLDGYENGYTAGYEKGVNELKEYNMSDDLLTIIGSPVNMMKDMLGWDLLGINLWGLLSALITLVLGVWIIRKLV